jgi:excisionase family DNA binding protein
MPTPTETSERRTLTLDDLSNGGRSVLTIEETAETLNLKRTATYEAVRRGQLPSLRLGRRLFVPVPALLRLLNGEPVGSNSVDAA